LFGEIEPAFVAAAWRRDERDAARREAVEQRKAGDGAAEGVRDDSVDGAKLRCDLLENGRRHEGRAAIAFGETVAGKIERDAGDAEFAERGNERAPERVVVLPAVDEQNG